MRKRGAIPPLSKRQHQRNNVVERVCRIEAAPLPAAVVVRLVRPYNPYEPYHPYPLSTQNRFCSNEPSARVTTFAFSGAAWKPTIQVYTFLRCERLARDSVLPSLEFQQAAKLFPQRCSTQFQTKPILSRRLLRSADKSPLR